MKKMFASLCVHCWGSKIQRRIILVVIIAVIIIVSLFFFRQYQLHSNKTKQVAQAIIVPIVKAKSATWHKLISSVGTIQAQKGIVVKADTSGRITKVMVKSGQMVQKGQALFEINPKIIQAKLNAQKAQLTKTQDQLQRIKILYQEKVASKAQYEKALYTYQQDKADVKSFQEQLNQKIIRAPFSGHFGLTDQHLGSYVAVGTSLGSLQSVGKQRVDFAIPGSYYNQVQKGDTVFVASPALKSKIIAKVYAIDSAVSRNTRMLKVRALLTQPILTPGMFVEATLQLKPTYSVVVVPQTAVLRSLSGDVVYAVVDGKAQETLVKIDERRGSVLSITKGLTAGELVLSGGQNKVMNGVPVTDKGALKA
jgi:membrane fusion protein (multidrug efflux system)